MAAIAAGFGDQITERTHTRRASSGRPASIASLNRERYEAQRSRRRGPTPEMFFAKHIDNTRIVKADDPERRREVRRFTVVMGIFFLLTMVYVWQHFSAIEVGYRVEAQKKTVEQLREQNRQLMLSEAQLTDPGRIDRIATELGLGVPAPGQVVLPNGDAGDQPVLAQMHLPAQTPVN